MGPERNSNGSSSIWLKLAPIILVIVGMIASAVVWANNQQVSIQEKINVSKSDVMVLARETFAKREEFTKIQECIDNTKATLQEIKKEQSVQREKIDTILERIPRRR
jgi:peptidoglycan hydrolase CwlO-like protein